MGRFWEQCSLEEVFLRKSFIRKEIVLYIKFSDLQISNKLSFLYECSNISSILNMQKPLNSTCTANLHSKKQAP